MSVNVSVGAMSWAVLLFGIFIIIVCVIGTFLFYGAILYIIFLVLKHVGLIGLLAMV